MRTLTWVSAGMLSLVSAVGGVFAQDSLWAKAAAAGPVLAIDLQPSDGNSLQYELNEPAYVAAFAVYSGGATELLYPYAASDSPEASGTHVRLLTYLGTEGEERQAVFAWYPMPASWACVYAVASRQPLHLEQYASHPLALAKALGYRSVSLSAPQDGLAPVLNSVRPSYDSDWATDELCGGVGPQSFALAAPVEAYYAQRPTAAGLEPSYDEAAAATYAALATPTRAGQYDCTIREGTTRHGIEMIRAVRRDSLPVTRADSIPCQSFTPLPVRRHLTARAPGIEKRVVVTKVGRKPELKTPIVARGDNQPIVVPKLPGEYLHPERSGVFDGMIRARDALAGSSTSSGRPSGGSAGGRSTGGYSVSRCCYPVPGTRYPPATPPSPTWPGSAVGRRWSHA
jgi:hypothetical protein